MAGKKVARVHAAAQHSTYRSSCIVYFFLLSTFFFNSKNLSQSHSVIKYLKYALNIHNPKIVFNKLREEKALPFCKWHVNVSVHSRYQTT